MWIPTDKDMSSFGLMTSTVALERSKLRIMWLKSTLENGNPNNSQGRSLHFLCLAKGGAESSVPRAREKREGLTPGHNTGYAVLLAMYATPRKSTNVATPKILLKIMYPKVLFAFNGATP